MADGGDAAERDEELEILVGERVDRGLVVHVEDAQHLSGPMPMSGVHMALRTLWIRIDLPLKRSSAAALSERIATRSSTALRAIDCGTCLRGVRVAGAAAARLAGPAPSVVGVEQQDRDPVHVHDLERDVHHLVRAAGPAPAGCDSSFEISSSSDELLLAPLRLGLAPSTLRWEAPPRRRPVVGTIAGTPPDDGLTGSWRTIVPCGMARDPPVWLASGGGTAGRARAA